MARGKKLASIHIISTVWFIISMCYLVVSALREAGVNWWIVFSLSGHGILVALILISLYLFAIFRGISSSQKIEIEHPLTSTPQYAFFYVATPFLGGLAGCFGMIGENTVYRFILGMTLGTLATTFAVWVIIDPAIGLLEMLLPASRKHFIQRQAQAKAQREQRQRDNKSLLDEVSSREESNRRYWRTELAPQAQKLAELLIAADEADFEQIMAEREAAGIGARAWQTGGISCMRELRDMAIAISKEKSKKTDIVDYTPSWWDGIGSWRSSPIG